MFTGSLVALITPFKNGSVDEKGFEKFVGLADQGGHRRPGAVRHDRRIAHAVHATSTSG